MEYYVGDRAKNYDRDRVKDPKWAFEDAALKATLAALTDVKSVIDAPVGSGRFLSEYQVRAVGYDSSSDMLAQAKKRGTAAKLELLDIVNAPLPTRADLVVCFRFLNLVDGLSAQKSLANLLKAARKYALFTCRVAQETIKIGRVTAHPEADILSAIEAAGFAVQEAHVYADEVPGQYTIFLVKKQSVRRAAKQELHDSDNQPDDNPTAD